MLNSINKNSTKTTQWQAEMSQAIKTIKQAESFFSMSLPKGDYPIFIPLRIANKIKQNNLQGALAKQFLPVSEEYDSARQKYGFIDPIGDQIKNQGNGLIHRYENRILFSPTSICPINCRYCFRKNELYSNDPQFKGNIVKASLYLNEHPEIEEVILTGGDPLILSNEKLRSLFEEIIKINNIKYLRIHTRTPVILPSRIDSGFLKLLNDYSKRFKMLSIVIHTNHIDELDQQVLNALEKLNLCGIQLMSQSVLLKNVNDSATILSKLFHKLIDQKVRPYYLHHPDKVKGAMHFYTDPQSGKEIYLQLRQLLPGWAIPHYVIDSPDGKGKEIL